MDRAGCAGNIVMLLIAAVFWYVVGVFRGELAVDAALVAHYLPHAGVAILVVAAILVVRNIFKETSPVPVFFTIAGIAAFLLIAYVYIFPNGIGGDEKQIVTMVQPNGDDAARDAQYAEINIENSKVNAANAGTVFIYVMALLLCVAVFTAVGFFLNLKKAG